MFVYVAHPIDQGMGAVGSLLTTLRFQLADRSVDSYWPTPAWAPSPISNDPAVQSTKLAINGLALSNANGIVAVLPDDSPTLGTPIEIENALESGKPALLFIGAKVGKSLQVQAWRKKGAILVPFERPSAPEVGRKLDEFVERCNNFVSVRQVSLQVKLEGGVMPTRGYEGDAGFDLYCTTGGLVEPGQYATFATDVRVALPVDTWGMLVGRSSTAQKGLLVNQAVIDNGYTGPMHFGVTNVSTKAVQVMPGDRLAQLIPMPLLAHRTPLVKVATMPTTDRGEAGFGSTGN